MQQWRGLVFWGGGGGAVFSLINHPHWNQSLEEGGGQYSRLFCEGKRNPIFFFSLKAAPRWAGSFFTWARLIRSLGRKIGVYVADLRSCFITLWRLARSDHAAEYWTPALPPHPPTPLPAIAGEWCVFNRIWVPAHYTGMIITHPRVLATCWESSKYEGKDMLKQWSHRCPEEREKSWLKCWLLRRTEHLSATTLKYSFQPF